MIEIIDKISNKITYFKDIQPGNIFLYYGFEEGRGIPYMKLDRFTVEGKEGIRNAIPMNPNQGPATRFSDNTIVEPVKNVKLILEN